MHTAIRDDLDIAIRQPTVDQYTVVVPVSQTCNWENTSIAAARSLPASNGAIVQRMLYGEADLAGVRSAHNLRWCARCFSRCAWKSSTHGSVTEREMLMIRLIFIYQSPEAHRRRSLPRLRQNRRPARCYPNHPHCAAPACWERMNRPECSRIQTENQGKQESTSAAAPAQAKRPWLPKPWCRLPRQRYFRWEDVPATDARGYCHHERSRIRRRSMAQTIRAVCGWLMCSVQAAAAVRLRHLG